VGVLEHDLSVRGRACMSIVNPRKLLKGLVLAPNARVYFPRLVSCKDPVLVALQVKSSVEYFFLGGGSAT
jgi:hypothetical protein